MAIYKPRKEVSEETNPADTLILAVQPSQLCGNKFLWFKSSVCGTLSWQPYRTNTIITTTVLTFHSTLYFTKDLYDLIKIHTHTHTHTQKDVNAYSERGTLISSIISAILQMKKLKPREAW